MSCADPTGKTHHNNGPNLDAIKAFQRGVDERNERSRAANRRAIETGLLTAAVLTASNWSKEQAAQQQAQYEQAYIEQVLSQGTAWYWQKPNIPHPSATDGPTALLQYQQAYAADEANREALRQAELRRIEAAAPRKPRSLFKVAMTGIAIYAICAALWWLGARMGIRL